MPRHVTLRIVSGMAVSRVAMVGGWGREGGGGSRMQEGSETERGRGGEEEGAQGHHQVPPSSFLVYLL